MVILINQLDAWDLLDVIYSIQAYLFLLDDARQYIGNNTNACIDQFERLNRAHYLIDLYLEKVNSFELINLNKTNIEIFIQ